MEKELENFKDINITCGCGREFVWTKGQQWFLHDLLEKGKIQVLKQPKRCSRCKQEASFK